MKGNGPITRIEAANRKRAEALRGAREIRTFSSAAEHLTGAYEAALKSFESRSPPERTDTGIEGIIGYRQWGASLRGLAAATAPSFLWQPGTNKATCLVVRQGHAAPNWNCHCGFNVYYDKPPSLSHGEIAGSILAWGNIEAHTNGFRAEYARVLMLAKTDGIPDVMMRALATMYSVPLVATSDLEMATKEYGNELPVEHRYGR